MTTKNANSYSSHVLAKTIYFSKNSSEDLAGLFLLLIGDGRGRRRQEREKTFHGTRKVDISSYGGVIGSYFPGLKTFWDD